MRGRAARLAPGDGSLVDGVFPQRPEREALWDVRIFVDVRFDEARRRGVAGDGAAERPPYERRYLPARRQRRYLEAVEPRRRFDAAVVNDDPAVPRLVIGRTGG